MLLTITLLGLTCALFWAGFLTRPHAIQYRSQAGFFVCLALTGLSAYFAWQESGSVAELATLIDPVPEITDVTHVPTSAEVKSIAGFMATIPGKGRGGTTQADRQDLAERASERRTDYWLMKSALQPDAIFAFYREVAPRRGWSIETDDPPWLILGRGSETLVVFVTDDFPRPGTRLLYGHSEGRPLRAQP